MNILVPESATDQELTDLLNQLLQDASQRTGFQYHDHPRSLAFTHTPAANTRRQAWANGKPWWQ